MIVKKKDGFIFTLSTQKNKKYDVYLGKKKIASFGDKRYQHYFDRIGYYKALDHRDPKRRRLYRLRHRNDNTTHPTSAGYFSWHYLWWKNTQKSRTFPKKAAAFVNQKRTGQSSKPTATYFFLKPFLLFLIIDHRGTLPIWHTLLTFIALGPKTPILKSGATQPFWQFSTFSPSFLIFCLQIIHFPYSVDTFARQNPIFFSENLWNMPLNGWRLRWPKWLPFLTFFSPTPIIWFYWFYFQKKFRSIKSHATPATRYPHRQTGAISRK